MPPALVRLAAASVALTGLLHAVLVPEYLEEAPRIGVSFVLAAAACLLAAWLVARQDDARAWVFGASLCLAMAVGLIASRTVGLLGFHESEWELSAIVSLLLEGTFLVLAARRLVALRGDMWPASRGLV
jgi:hypothetical protein